MAPKKRVLVPLAQGFEELEAIAVVDLLRRAGAWVVTASVDTGNPITGCNRIRVLADIDLPEALEEWGDNWDLVVLPGGPAVDILGANGPLMALLTARISAGQLVGAICAAPKLLAAAGLSVETAVTNYPGCRGDLEAFTAYREDAVVVDGPIITSRGPGTSVAFGLALVRALYGDDAADRLAIETASTAV